MKALKYIYIFVISLVIVACGNENATETLDNNDGVYKMTFIGNVTSYLNNSQRSRLASSSFNDGASMIIRLNNGGNVVKGKAIYHGDSKEWSFICKDELKEGTYKCAVLYFINPGTITDDEVSFDSQTYVFGNKDCDYSYSNSDGLVIKADLSPLLSRIRFEGEANSSIVVEGIMQPTSFNLNTLEFSETTSQLPLTVQTDGYTPYVYYTKASSENLSIKIGNNLFYIKSPLHEGGYSNYITIPSAEYHEGWTFVESPASGEYVDLGLSVKWGSCNLGAYKPEGIGLYYAWGETIGYTRFETNRLFNMEQYKFWDSVEKKYTKYCTDSYYGVCDGKTLLDSEDDAATISLGDGWRMPLQSEFEELFQKCSSEWVVVNKVPGMLFVGHNGNSLFIPASGFLYESDNHNSLSYLGESCCLWTKERPEDDAPTHIGDSFYAWINPLLFGTTIRTHSRYRGLNIRPVYTK